MERTNFPKRQVKPQRGLPSLNLTVTKPRFSPSGMIAPQAHTRAIQKPLKWTGWRQLYFASIPRALYCHPPLSVMATTAERSLLKSEANWKLSLKLSIETKQLNKDFFSYRRFIFCTYVFDLFNFYTTGQMLYSGLVTLATILRIGFEEDYVEGNLNLVHELRDQYRRR
jgi:hypothetical protein